MATTRKKTLKKNAGRQAPKKASRPAQAATNGHVTVAPAAPEAKGPASEPKRPAPEAKRPAPEAKPPAPEAKPPVPGEWAREEPSPKGRRMGLVRLTLDEGVKTTIVGHVYGLDFEIDGKGHHARVFFDYYSKRLKVLDYEATDYRAMIHRLNWLARANDFDKIFFKAKREDWQKFLAFGYVLEGILRYYFKGEDAYVLSKFTSADRINSPHLIEEGQLIENLMAKPRAYEPPPLPNGYDLVVGTPEHIPKLVSLYRRVFETYPSPLTHPDYILQTMERNVVYRIITNERGDVVSAASAEIDEKHANAELTDCATKNTQRGKGLMFHILRKLEDDLRDRGIMTAYTLARAKSVGMNSVFYRLGYEFSGRLVNNCDIYGHFEDMNIWVRRL
jgi:beta-lysine N6-acetyltransferase